MNETATTSNSSDFLKLLSMSSLGSEEAVADRQLGRQETHTQFSPCIDVRPVLDQRYISRERRQRNARAMALVASR